MSRNARKPRRGWLTWFMRSVVRVSSLCAASRLRQVLCKLRRARLSCALARGSRVARKCLTLTCSGSRSRASMFETFEFNEYRRYREKVGKSYA